MSAEYDVLELDTETPSQRRARILARSDADLMLDLIKVRRDKKISQKVLAERMGVTQATVASFERYDSDPKLSTIRRYAHALEALIKHVVVPDNGQYADGSEWLVVSMPRPTVEGAPMRLLSYQAAANSKATDFSLAA